jgi:hypothetical protein
MSLVRSFKYPLHFVIQAFSLHSFTTARTSLGHHVPTTDTFKYSIQPSPPSFRHSLVCTAQRLLTGWTVRGSNAGGGVFFRTHPDRPWGPPSLLCNGYRVSFPEVKRPELGDDHPPSLAPRLKKEHTCAWPALE